MRTSTQTTNLALVAAIDRGAHNLAAAIAAGDQRAVRLAIALIDATDQPGVEVDDWMLTQQARRNGRLWISTWPTLAAARDGVLEDHGEWAPLHITDLRSGRQQPVPDTAVA